MPKIGKAKPFKSQLWIKSPPPINLKTPSVIALALTWDGARHPAGSLPAAARAFLRGKSRIISSPSARMLAQLFASDAVKEIRICWVPKLSGGDNVLSAPFQSKDGLRVGFRMSKPRQFGGILGVKYRRILKR